MMKRLIMILFAVSVIAMLWPASTATAGCDWVRGSNGYCYACAPNIPYDSAGSYIDPSTCVYFYPGGLTEAVGVYGSGPDANKCLKDNDPSDCPTVVSAIFGRYDKNGTEQLYCLNVGVVDDKKTDDAWDCLVPYYRYCCDPGHYDKKTGECRDRQTSEGWAVFNTVYSTAAAALDNCRHNNCTTELSFFEDTVCPNPNWDGDIVPTNFDGTTCSCPLGFRQPANYPGATQFSGPPTEWECCYAEDASGNCTSFQPTTETDSNGEITATNSIDYWAGMGSLNCYYDDPTQVEDPFTGDYDACVPAGMQVDEGFCNQLFTTWAHQL